MTEGLEAEASSFGKDTASDPKSDNKVSPCSAMLGDITDPLMHVTLYSKLQTPAEQIKEKAIQEERREVADGSTNGHSTSEQAHSNTQANGISTNTEEAHASDIKDKMSSKTDSTTATTANGADDDASMIPLGKGGYSTGPMTGGNTTGNATPDASFSTGSTTEAASTSVTRAEINDAKQAIIHAVANCKLTREVVFSETDTGTDDGLAEVKRVLSGYKGIEEALAEMNRYIPVHVRDSHDLGVEEGNRIQKEQQNAADALTRDIQPTESTDTGAGITSSASGAPDEKITEKEALAEAPASTAAGNGSFNPTTGTTEGGLNDIQKEELNRISTPGVDTDKAKTTDSPVPEGIEPEPEHGITLGAGALPGAGAAAIATIPITEVEDGKAAEPVQEGKEVPEAATETIDTTLASSTPAVGTGSLASDDKIAAVDNGATPAEDTTNTGTKAPEADTSGIAAVGTADKGKGRATGDEDTTTETPVTSTPASPRSPNQGEKLSERLKREVEERARKGQLGVFNKPLGSNASNANLASATKEPTTAAGTSSTTQNKDGSASSAFTEEFGPGETGLSSPSSPTNVAGPGATTTSSIKPPSTRARAGSISSQTSTGEKRGLLGLFRRRSKRQSIGDNAAGRRSSTDLGRTVSRDTAATSPVTASAVPPAPEKPVETTDTTAPTATAADESEKKGDLAALGVGAGAASTAVAAASSSDEAGEPTEETPVVDKSTSTAEPSTSEHKVEEEGPVTEKSTQTSHEPAPALGTAAEPVTYAEEPAPSTGVAATTADAANEDDEASGIPRKESPDDMLGPGAVAAIAADEKEKEVPIHVEKENENDMIGPGALANALGETPTSSAAPAAVETTPHTTKEETTPASPTKAATAEKSTWTTAEKSTSTEEDLPATAAAPASDAAAPAPTAATPAVHADDDKPLYTKPSLDKSASPNLERRSSKSGGFFGLFRRRSSRRSSSGPPQRSASDVGKPMPVEKEKDTATTPSTENHVAPAIVAEKSEAEEAEKEVKDEPKTEEEEEETAFVHATDPNDPSSDAAKAELAREETEKEIAAEAEAVSEATIHAYGSLNVDELETVEEELERGPEETVGEPDGSVIDHDADHLHDDHEEDEEVPGEVDETADNARETPEPGTATGQEPAQEAVHEGERVSSPVVAATPAERLLSGERRKSRSGGFFGLFRSRSRKENKDKEQPSSHQQYYQKRQQEQPVRGQYDDIVRNMGVVAKPASKKDVAVSTDDVRSARSKSVQSPVSAANESIVDHGTQGENYEDAEEEVVEEKEEEIPDNRSITEIAASIPLPAPVYTEKTRAKHERIRKKREHEEALERERIRKENEVLYKRERIMNAYTGKQGEFSHCWHLRHSVLTSLVHDYRLHQSSQAKQDKRVRACTRAQGSRWRTVCQQSRQEGRQEG